MRPLTLVAFFATCVALAPPAAAGDGNKRKRGGGGSAQSKKKAIAEYMESPEAKAAAEAERVAGAEAMRKRMDALVDKFKAEGLPAAECYRKAMLEAM